MNKERAGRPLVDGSENAAGQQCLPDSNLSSCPLPGASPSKKSPVDRAYDEFCHLREAGVKVDRDEFCARFPNFQSSLQAILNVHSYTDKALTALRVPAEEDWPHAGDEFLGLRLHRQIGRGAFARVFLATEPTLGHRQVAVKIAWQGGHEACTLGRLEHRNVVPVYSIREDEKTELTAVCMPYLGCATLLDVLDQTRPGQLPLRSSAILDAIRSRGASSEAATADPVLRKGSYVRGIVHLGAQLADALAYVHAEGVLHRDLKPTNVLLTPEGRPMLLDFNLAFDCEADCQRLGGTLPYMSPEQLEATLHAVAAKERDATADSSGGWQGSFLAADPSPLAAPPVDERSDVFSLAVMLYELLAGFHPYGARSLRLQDKELCEHLRRRHQQGQRPLHLINPQVDPGLSLLIERCLALDPAERMATARELAARLRRSQRGLRPWLARLYRASVLRTTAVGALGRRRQRVDVAAARAGSDPGRGPGPGGLRPGPVHRRRPPLPDGPGKEPALCRSAFVAGTGRLEAGQPAGSGGPPEKGGRSGLTRRCPRLPRLQPPAAGRGPGSRGVRSRAGPAREPAGPGVRLRDGCRPPQPGLRRPAARTVGRSGPLSGAGPQAEPALPGRPPDPNPSGDVADAPGRGLPAALRHCRLSPRFGTGSGGAGILLPRCLPVRGDCGTRQAGEPGRLVPAGCLTLAQEALRQAVEGRFPLEDIQGTPCLRTLLAALPTAPQPKGDPTKLVRPTRFFDPLEQ